MIKYSQNNLIYAQKTHSASLYATYMRTEKDGFHSQNSLFVLCTTVNILQYKVSTNSTHVCNLPSLIIEYNVIL